MIASNEMARRSFFERATQFLGLLIAGGMGIPALIYLLRGPNSVAPGGFVDVGDLVQMKPRVPEEVSFQRIRKDGWKLMTEKSTAWVVKLSDTEVVAYTPQCTHLGCAYRYEESKNEFVCPCHSTNFSIEGKVLNGPAPRDLDRYSVKVRGTRLLIGTIQSAKPMEGKNNS